MVRSTPVLAILLALAALAPSLRSQSYQSPLFVGIGGNPTSIRHADLDEDGDEDLVICDSALPNAYVVPNDGGVFGTTVTLALPGPATDLVVDDLDGNGTPDIAVLGNTPGQLTVFLNDGNGGFPAGTSFAAGSLPARMIAFDIDGDGFRDMVVARTDINLVGVLLNDGSGGFVDVGNAPGVFAPSALATADLDGDGDGDLVVASSASGVVLTVRNDGTAFTPVAFLAVGSVPLDLIIADTDHDLRPDIITANTGGGSITVLRNQGNFNFVRADFPTPVTPLRVAVTNADNALGIDLAVTCLTASQTVVLTNDGQGNFSQTFSTLSGVNPAGLTSVDFNGDFAEDLCVLDVPSGSIRYIENQGPFLPLYPGTGDDLDVATGVNGPALAGPGERSKVVRAGDAVSLRMFSPGGSYVGSAASMVVQLFYRAFPPITPIPGLHVNEFGFGAIVALQSPGISPIGDTLPFPFPPGFEGLSLMTQAIVLTPTAANGIFASSPGYELIIKP